VKELEIEKIEDFEMIEKIEMIEKMIIMIRLENLSSCRKLA
jgi:hypothetical protein